MIRHWSCAGCWHNSVVKEVEKRWLPAGISVELSTQPLYLGVRYLLVGSIVGSVASKEVDQSCFQPTDNICSVSCVGQHCFRWWEFTRVMAGWTCAQMDGGRMERWWWSKRADRR